MFIPLKAIEFIKILCRKDTGIYKFTQILKGVRLHFLIHFMIVYASLPEGHWASLLIILHYFLKVIFIRYLLTRL